MEARLKGEDKVTICEQQYSSCEERTADSMFVWRMLIEKYRESQIELHCVFEDLKKAYDRLLREEL